MYIYIYIYIYTHKYCRSFIKTDRKYEDIEEMLTSPEIKTKKQKKKKQKKTSEPLCHPEQYHRTED